MAVVTRDPRDGRWLVRWRDPSGRQRKKSFSRKVDAQRWSDQMQAASHRGQFIDPVAAKVKVGDFAQTWLDGMAHLKPSTAARYASIVRVHIEPQWGQWSLGQIRHSDVTAWIGRLVAGGSSPGTVRQIHRVLSMILETAVTDGRIATNPAAKVRLPSPVRGEPRFLTAGEVTSLIHHAGEEGISVAILAFTGLRFGELAALRVRRVDLARHRLTIAESVTEVGGRLSWTTPKTHHTRSVPFPPSLLAPIQSLCVHREPEDLVFTSPEGGPLRLNNWRRRVFDPACKELGLTDVSPHDLRHTAASLAIQRGANVKAVQRMLGHASAAMTLDVYAGLFSDDLDSVAVALDPLVPQMCHNGSFRPPEKVPSEQLNQF